MSKLAVNEESPVSFYGRRKFIVDLNKRWKSAHGRLRYK